MSHAFHERFWPLAYFRRWRCFDEAPLEAAIKPDALPFRGIKAVIFYAFRPHRQRGRFRPDVEALS